MTLVNAQIDGFNQELQKLVSSAQDQDNRRCWAATSSRRNASWS